MPRSGAGKNAADALDDAAPAARRVIAGKIGSASAVRQTSSAHRAAAGSASGREARLPVQGHRVVDARLDAALAEERREGVATRRAHDEGVPGVDRRRRGGRRAASAADPRAPRRSGARCARARVCHAGEARRLGEEHRGLQGVEAAVAPELRRARTAAIAPCARSRRTRAATSSRDVTTAPAVAPGAEVLRGEEAEAAGVARRRRAARPRVVARADGLRRVLDQRQAFARRQRRERAQRRAAARRGRTGQDGADAQPARARARPIASSTVRSLAFIVVRRRRRRRPGRAPVAAMASAAATNESAGVTTASPAPMPERAQRELQRVRPRRHAHRVRHPALRAPATARTPRRAARG